MKTLRIINNHPPGSLQNPAFRYKKASETDVAKTFARIRRELATRAGDSAQQPLPMFVTMTVKGRAA